MLIISLLDIESFFGIILLQIFCIKISNFIAPPPPLSTVSLCLTPAGGPNPAGQLPEVS